MLRKCITHCVEKPPWRINIPGVGRTVLMGDIVHAAAGAATMLIITLPATLIFGGAMAMFALIIGAPAGILVNKWSPGKMGWRYFMAVFLRFHARRIAQPGKAKAVMYLGLYARPPRHARISSSEQRTMLTPRHVQVGPGYKIRPDDPDV